MSRIYTSQYTVDTCEVREFSTFEEARGWARGLHKPKVKDGFFVPRCGSIMDYNIYMSRIENEIHHWLPPRARPKPESKLVILHKDITNAATVIFVVFKRHGPPPSPPSPSYILFKKYTLEEAKEIGGEVWEQWKEEKVKRMVNLTHLQSLGQEFIDSYQKYWKKRREEKKNTI